MNRLSKQIGFTLLELVIAISIMAIVVVVGYSSITRLISAKEVIEDGGEAQSIANAITERVTRELQLAVSGIAIYPNKDNPKFRYPNTVNFIAAKGDDDIQSISFVTKNAAQYIMGYQSASNISKITYRAEPDPESSALTLYYLIREETPQIKPIEKAFERTMIFPITRRLQSIKFRFYSTKTDSWSEEWGKDDRIGLPSLVEIAVELLSPKGNLFAFKTTVALNAESAGP